MQFKGSGTKADPVGAMKWAMIASAATDPDTKAKAKVVVQQYAAALTQNQVADAGQAAQLWLIRHQIQAQPIAN